MMQGEYALLPPEIVEFIVLHASDQITKAEMRKMVEEKFDRTVSRTWMYKFYKRAKLPCGEHDYSKCRLVTQEQAEYMAEIIPYRPATEVTAMVNERFGLDLTVQQVRGWKKNHRFGSGYDTKFRKGVRSHNAGKKIEEFMSPEQIEHFKATQYTKGHRSKNSVPVGTITWRDGYLLIKYQDFHGVKNFMPLHRFIWQQANGPIPKGYKIYFKDGDRSNCKLENLDIVKNSVLTAANRWIGMTDNREINDAVIALAKLKVEVSDKEKKKKRSKKNDQKIL